MALSVLGPLALDGDHGPRPLPGRKAREILTLLVLASPRPLSVHALVEAIWEETPPAAVKTVQAHLSRVRTALATTTPLVGAITGGPAGYRFEAVPDLVDVSRIESLRRQARVAALRDDHTTAANLLAAACQLWRGEPELPMTPAGDLDATRLAETRLQLREEHCAASIRAGWSAEVVPELEQLVDRHPLRERIRQLQIEALYRSGRRADALSACRAARLTLRDEAGLSPGPELQALERAVFTEELPDLTNRPPARTMDPALTFDGPAYAQVGDSWVAHGAFNPRSVRTAGSVLLINPTFVPIDSMLEEPHLSAALAALAGSRRLLAYDRRGVGLSDPVTETLSLQDWVDDAVATLDAEGVQRVDVFANADTAMVALMLAAEHPERVKKLCLVNPYPRFTQASDYPHGLPATAAAARLDAIHTPARTPPAPVDVLSWRLPAVAADPAFRLWWDAVGRRGASPRSAAVMHRLIRTADVRSLLQQVSAPTLLLVRRGCASYEPGHARFLASRLPCATLIEHDDPNDAWYVGDVEWVTTHAHAFFASAGD